MIFSLTFNRHPHKYNNRRPPAMHPATTGPRAHFYRPALHLRLLLGFALRILLIEGSDSYTITQRSWDYK